MKNTKYTFSNRFFVQIGLAVFALAFAIAPALSHAAVLTRSLGMGSTGADVSSLQSFLAADVTLYPQGLVTGYYGFLTKSTVSNFQTRNSIDPVGLVGPITLPVLNAQMAGGMGSDISAPIVYTVTTNPARNNAVVAWNTSENAQGTVYYSINPLATYESEKAVSVSGAMSAATDAGLRTGQNVTLSNLTANTTYYFMVYSTDQSGNVSVSWPSTFRTTN